MRLRQPPLSSGVMRHMKLARKHASLNVLARFRNGEYWEEWELRYNRGSKKHKPVKFFANLRWRSDYDAALCPFSAYSWDFPTEQDARASFIEQIAEYGGELHDITTQLAKEIFSRFGHMPHNYSLKRTAAGWLR